jgi:uncharacterized protein YaeQ
MIVRPAGRLSASVRSVGASTTVYSFEISLSDSDRGVYESLALRVAQHPSETAEYLCTRVLAYCLELTEGLAFSKGGLSDRDAPALAVRDLSGVLKGWIEIGLPEPPRLHKATKASPRVVVYPHKDIDAWLVRIKNEPVHRSDEIEIYSIDRDLIAQLAARLSRRMKFDLVATGHHLYLSFDDGTLDGAVTRIRIGETA